LIFSVSISTIQVMSRLDLPSHIQSLIAEIGVLGIREILIATNGPRLTRD